MGRELEFEQTGYLITLGRGEWFGYYNGIIVIFFKSLSGRVTKYLRKRCYDIWICFQIKAEGNWLGSKSNNIDNKLVIVESEWQLHWFIQLFYFWMTDMLNKKEANNRSIWKNQNTISKIMSKLRLSFRPNGLFVTFASKIWSFGIMN